MSSTPQVRFSGFGSDWLSKSFSNTFSVLPNNTFSRAALNDEEGSVKNVHYGDVLIKFGSVLDVSKELIPYISSDELAEKWKSAVLQNGDIVIADTAEDTTVGKCAEMGGIDSDIVVSGLHTIPVRPLVSFSACYLGYYMNTDAFHNQLLPLMQGTKVSSISKSALNETLLHFPAELTEQSKIAELFVELDRIILYQQQKCDKLIALKAACLDKLFPKNGSKVPEVRFAGFSGDWEQRKLDNLCDLFTDGDWIEAKDQSDAGIRLVQTGNVGTTEYLDKPNNKKWISEDTFDRLHCEEIYPGDILISRLPEPAGRACIMPDLGTRMITAVDCTIVRTSKENDSRYLVQYLSTPSYFNVVNSFLGGGTRQRISRGNLSGIEVPIPPSLEEQRRIGTFLADIDNLITLHQRKLDKLRQFKESMLHKMFV